MEFTGTAMQFSVEFLISGFSFVIAIAQFKSVIEPELWIKWLVNETNGFFLKMES